MTYLLPELTQDRAAPIPDPTGLSPIAALFAARQVDHLTLTNDFFVNLLDMNTKWEASSTSEGVFEGAIAEWASSSWPAPPGPRLRFELPAQGHRGSLCMQRLAAGVRA